MKLYYTVAAGYNVNQDNPVNSVGGYKSATPVSNDLLDSLFDELSLRTMNTTEAQYKAIVLVNESAEKATNIQLYFSAPEGQTTYCNFMIAAVQMSKDFEGNPVMEKIQNMYAKPFHAQFFNATIQEPVGLGDLEPGQMLGLWLSRTPNKEVILKDYDNVAEIDPLRSARGSWYKPVVKEKEERVDMNLTWE